jgi:hypothetical protein
MARRRFVKGTTVWRPSGLRHSIQQSGATSRPSGRLDIRGAISYHKRAFKGNAIESGCSQKHSWSWFSAGAVLIRAMLAIKCRQNVSTGITDTADHSIVNIPEIPPIRKASVKRRLIAYQYRIDVVLTQQP